MLSAVSSTFYGFNKQYCYYFTPDFKFVDSNDGTMNAIKTGCITECFIN